MKSAEELLELARDDGATILHPVGTCKMGSDPMAVVDCSIMPTRADSLARSFNATMHKCMNHRRRHES